MRSVTDAPPSATSPDTRTVRVHEAVSTAIRELFEEDGSDALTHLRVAERAGVGRATVYRHWPRPLDLLMEALSVVDQPLLREGSGPLRSWLRGELARAGTELSGPAAQQFVAALISIGERVPAVAELRESLLNRTRAVLERALDRAVDADELAHRPDPDALLGRLLGPIIFETAIRQQPVSDDTIAEVVDAALGPHS
jgi:AcrR family transcriptional regulator